MKSRFGSGFPGWRNQRKVLSAYRAGIRRVILPSRNEGDVEQIADDVRQQLELVFVSRISE